MIINKKIFISAVFISTLINLSITNFVSAKDNTKVFSKDDAKINVQKGSSFIIKLDSNASTGYKWDLSKPVDAKMLKLISSKYEQAKQESDDPMVGVPGVELWKFSALKKGMSVIKLKYHRSWEKTVDSSDELTFKVNIK